MVSKIKATEKATEMNWLTEWKHNKRVYESVYTEFRDYANSIGFCWACGRSVAFKDRPGSFHGIWLIHRAHITSKPRLKDRRVVNLLCPLCHAIADDGSDDRITLENMIYLKQLFDPEYFDLDLLQKCSIRKLPEPQELQAEQVQEFHSRRGLTRGPIDI